MRALSAATVAILVACGDPASPLNVSAVLGDDVTLAPGQEARIDGIVTLTFLNVRTDSRCPVDVLCAWAGNAEVDIALAVASGPATPFTVNLPQVPHHVDFGELRVTIVELRPEPRTTRQIDPAVYRARFSLEAVAQP